MHIKIMHHFSFFIFLLFVCLFSLFLSNTDAQTENDPTPPSSQFIYTYESIDVPGVDFLALTASSDF
ncbi:MAG: hypothetical protein OXC79_07985, partial [Candidatus Poribacteria bacterium]|nr:hypothetical protein [Candidatus Poribacteria bacterium]